MFFLSAPDRDLLRHSAILCYFTFEHARVVLELRGIAQAMQFCVPWPTDKLNHTIFSIMWTFWFISCLDHLALLERLLWILGCPFLMKVQATKMSAQKGKQIATIIFAKDVPFCFTGALTALTEWRCLILLQKIISQNFPFWISCCNCHYSM